MSNLTKRNTFTALTTAQASQVNENFDDLVSFVNNEVIHSDGSQAMTGRLTGPNVDPVAENDYTRKKYVDDAVGDARAAARNASNLSSGTVPTARINSGAVVAAGEGLKARDNGRRLIYGVATLTFSGSATSANFTITAPGFNACTLTPVGGDFTAHIVSNASGSVTIRGAALGPITGTRQVHYMVVCQA